LLFSPYEIGEGREGGKGGGRSKSKGVRERESVRRRREKLIKIAAQILGLDFWKRRSDRMPDEEKIDGIYEKWRFACTDSYPRNIFLENFVTSLENGSIESWNLEFGFAECRTTLP
jgi:hypothetical protein